MKKKLLSWYTKKLLSRRSGGTNPSYTQAQSVGVIVNTQWSWDGLDGFIDAIEDDKKTVHVLRFVKKPDADSQDKSQYSPSDFSFFGKVKSSCLDEFTEKSYDILFVLDRQPTEFVDYIAARANGLLNVGFYYEKGNQLADLQVKPDPGRELDDLLWYTRQLS